MIPRRLADGCQISPQCLLMCGVITQLSAQLPHVYYFRCLNLKIMSTISSDACNRPHHENHRKTSGPRIKFLGTGEGLYPH